MKRKDQRAKIKTNVVISLGVFLLVCFLLFGISLLEAANPFSQKEVIVNIPQGASAYDIQEILESEEVLRPYSGFAFASRVLGASSKIKAGRYKFSSSQPLIVVLLKLKNGHVLPPKQFKVTFPEGSSIYKMGQILKQQGFSDYKDFQALVRRGITEPLRNRHWELFKYIPSQSLEGYLYPETYLFHQEASVEQITEKMLLTFEQKVLPFWRRAKKDTKYTLHEIITLASIIEKEAQKESERKIISSVYHNRLRIGMALGACPTIKYALNDPTPKVYNWQLEVDSPYNTYKNRGLPPGPICNPGIESIKAAVYPARTHYFFFVAKADGSHIFSRTMKEHQQARQKVATPTQ